MERVDYAAQRVDLLRSLAASMSEERSRCLIFGLADDFEKRARYKKAALEMLSNRESAQ